MLVFRNLQIDKYPNLGPTRLKPASFSNESALCGSEEALVGIMNGVSELDSVRHQVFLEQVELMLDDFWLVAGGCDFDRHSIIRCILTQCIQEHGQALELETISQVPIINFHFFNRRGKIAG